MDADRSSLQPVMTPPRSGSLLRLERSASGKATSKRLLTLSERMARITKTNTGPELAVRSLLHALGLRFRLHRSDLRGTPDIVLPGRQKVILVHGCFWHRHGCSAGSKVPRANPAYWTAKFDRNRNRDRENLARLHELGWSTLIIWECETSDIEALRVRLLTFLCASSSAATSCSFKGVNS